MGDNVDRDTKNRR